MNARGQPNEIEQPSEIEYFSAAGCPAYVFQRGVAPVALPLRQPFCDSPSATALPRQPFCKERLSLWSGFRSWGREPEGSSAETFKLPVRVSARRALAPQTPVLQALALLLLRDQDGDAS